MVSIQPLAEFCEQVGGENVQVSVMVPPGASPHSYEPTPGQLTEVGNADLYVKVGTPIDFELTWLDKIVAINPALVVCNASADIVLLQTAHKHDHEDRKETFDPHIWLAPSHAKLMVTNITEALISLDIIHKDYYAERTARYIMQLDSLDLYIRMTLGAKTQRRFIVYHPAWSYFAQEYGLIQVPVEDAGKPPTAKGIQSVIEEAQKQNIKVIFASPQFSARNAEVIAREIKGSVILIDPLDKEYLTNMKKVARIFSESME